MNKEIRKNKPECATHYRDGVYFKVICDQDAYEITPDGLVYVGNVQDVDFPQLENLK